MTKPYDREIIREKLVDCFMRDLDGMLTTQKDKWVVYTSSSIRPFGFYDSFMSARADVSVELGITSDFLIRQVTEDYRTYGRKGKSYGPQKRSSSK